MADVVHPAEVEAELVRLARLCERVTGQLARRARECAEAEVAYKVAYAKALLMSEGTVAEREARATVATEDLFLRRRIAEALQMSAQEAGRNYRAQLDALRTIAANVRFAIENAAGTGR